MLLVPHWPDVSLGVSLDIILLVLSFVAFLAGIAAFLFEELKTTEEPEDVAQCPQPEKEIAEETKLKAPEDLPEPEPEGCDEEGKKFVEVSLERIPGEAWGLCWHRAAFQEERLIFAGVDPNSPAGLWQQQRRAQGLPVVEHGDELMWVNDLSQHSCMKMSLVVSNRLRLKFLRSEYVEPGGNLPQADIKSEKPGVPLASFEHDEDIDVEYDGLQLNFWSYQRPPREPAQVKALEPSQSEPRPESNSSRGSRDVSDAKRRGRSTSRTKPQSRREAAHEQDSQIFSGSESDERCPSTDWEYMMDNRAGQACTAAANGNVVLMAGSHAYALPPGSLPLPCNMPAGTMPASMSEAQASAMAFGFQGVCQTPASGSTDIMWNYWQDSAVDLAPPQDAMQRAESPRGKKTYRAGQRLTARRLRAAQRAAEQAGSASESEAPRAKPRRRAGVRVRRRREHALRRREAEEQLEPLPPGLREAPERPAHPQSEGLVGEKVLINGLVHAAHLNGHWGHVTAHDAVQQRYAVQVLGSSVTLYLRRGEMVLPKTNPPRAEELQWQPNLRM